MYRVVNGFVDLQDDGYRYNVGDVFPRRGSKVSKERLDELSSNRNRRSIVLIVDEDPKEWPSEAEKDTQKSDAGVSPSNKSEAKRRPRKGQKKDA